MSETLNVLAPDGVSWYRYQGMAIGSQQKLDSGDERFYNALVAHMPKMTPTSGPGFKGNVPKVEKRPAPQPVPKQDKPQPKMPVNDGQRSSGTIARMERKKKGLAIPDKDVQYVSVGKWLVRSQTTRSRKYTIDRGEAICYRSSCQKLEEPCAHNYTCECKSAKPCKHIIKVHSIDDFIKPKRKSMEEVESGHREEFRRLVSKADRLLVHMDLVALEKSVTAANNMLVSCMQVLKLPLDVINARDSSPL